MIGLLSAMEEELELLHQRLMTTETAHRAGISFHRGSIGGIEVVTARCGVGKVNAAMAAQTMIDKFDITGLVFTGLAGSLVANLNRGDVVISNFLGQHDFDLTAFGKRHGQVTDSGRLIEASPKFVQAAVTAYEQSVAPTRKHNQMVVGTIVTGDSFIADAKRLKWIQREFGAVAAEMEGAAVAQVCQANGISFVVIRVISDSASGSAAGEFITFLDEASEVSYHIAEAMLPLLTPAGSPVLV